MKEKSKDDVRERMSLPVIPKKKISDEMFYNSPVKVIVPQLKEEKALTVLKMNGKNCKKEDQPNNTRGSHSKEAACLLRLRSLSYDCLQLIPKEGCVSISQRAEYWTKIELMNENLQKIISHAGEWDTIHNIDFKSTPSTSST